MRGAVGPPHRTLRIQVLLPPQLHVLARRSSQGARDQSVAHSPPAPLIAQLEFTHELHYSTRLGGGEGQLELPETRFAVVIEDDADIRQLLATVLEQAGFEPILTSNGLDGVSAVREHNPVVTTLDVSMPGIDGFETAKRIRALSSTYLVMLTARAEEIDMLQGLEAGADDYLTKPFRPRELRARIEAMLRRPRVNIQTTDVPELSAPPLQTSPHVDSGATQMLGSVDGHNATSSIARPAATELTAWREHRGLRLNSEERRVRINDDEIELTRTEFNLLEVLLQSGRRVRSKTELAELLRSEDAAFYVSDADKRAVEVHLANLRRKLGDHPTSPRWIETVRGIGYRLTAQEKP